MHSVTIESFDLMQIRYSSRGRSRIRCATTAPPRPPAAQRVLPDLREAIASYRLGGIVSGFAINGRLSLATAYRLFTARKSVFALTALYEPFGLAPLEAASTGLPVVVTRNGRPVESLRDEHTQYGILVVPSDPNDVASGLLRALDQRHHFARAGPRASIPSHGAQPGMVGSQELTILRFRSVNRSATPTAKSGRSGPASKPASVTVLKSTNT
ncbi:MAG TPA: glycosyltransferase [Actinobacteria bacterium]|nr:glycosyltransferase [Actinomycetota bacterium]